MTGINTTGTKSPRIRLFTDDYDRKAGEHKIFIKSVQREYSRACIDGDVNVRVTDSFTNNQYIKFLKLRKQNSNQPSKTKANRRIRKLNTDTFTSITTNTKVTTITEENSSNKKQNPETTIRTTDTTNGPGRRDVIFCESSGKNVSNRKTRNTIFTFILQKQNIKTGWQRPVKEPTYAEFNHGNHLHIIFASGSEEHNCNRQRTTICNHIGASDAGYHEATASMQKVFHRGPFILDCIRHGAKSIRIFVNTNCGP